MTFQESALRSSHTSANTSMSGYFTRNRTKKKFPFSEVCGRMLTCWDPTKALLCGFPPDVNRCKPTYSTKTSLGFCRAICGLKISHRFELDHRWLARSKRPRLEL